MHIIISFVLYKFDILNFFLQQKITNLKCIDLLYIFLQGVVNFHFLKAVLAADENNKKALFGFLKQISF